MPNLSIETLAAQLRAEPPSWGTLDVDAAAQLTGNRPPEVIRSQWYNISGGAAEIAMRFNTPRAAADFVLEQIPPRSDEDEARELYDAINLDIVPLRLRWNPAEETLVQWRVRWNEWSRHNPNTAAQALRMGHRPETTGPEGTAFLPDGWTENRWEA